MKDGYSAVGEEDVGSPLGDGWEAGSVRVQRSSLFAEVHTDSSRGMAGGIIPLGGLQGEGLGVGCAGVLSPP